MKLNTKFIPFFLSASILTAAIASSTFLAPTVFANPVSLPGLPSNPDDYHVEKYRALLHEARDQEQAAARVLQARQNAVAETQQQIDIAASKLREVNEGIQTQTGIIERAQAEIRQNEARIAELNQDLSRLPAQIQEAERLLAQAQQRKNQIQQQFNRAKEALRERETYEAQKLQYLKAQQAELRTAQQAAAQASEREATLVAQIQKLTQELEQARVAITQSDARIAEAQTQIQQTQERIQKLNDELTTYRARATEADQIATAMERRATQAEQAGTPNAPELRRKATELRTFANEAKQRVSQLERNLSVANEQLLRHKKALEVAQNQRQDAQATIQRNQSEIATLSPSLTEARRVSSNARAEVTQAEAKVKQAQLEYQAAKSFAEEGRNTVTSLDRELKQAETVSAQAQTRLNELQGRRTQILAQISTLNQESTQEAQKLRAAREKREELARTQDQQERLLSGFRSELQVRTRERNEAASYHAQTRELLEQRSRRLSVVEENLRRGIEVAREIGRNDGSRDGYQAGQRDGYERGSREGQIEGEREGKSRGIEAGIARARSQGSSDGQSRGLQEGIQRGTQDGNAKGQSDGQTKGTSDGLIAGFDAGKKEGTPVGYKEGEVEGHQLGGYTQGKNQGVAQGSERARSEAKSRGTQDGYARGEKEFLSANLNEVNLPQERLSGFVSRSFNHSTPYQPLSGRIQNRFPHPEIERSYEESYRTSYTREAAAAYEVSYRESHRRAYDQFYRSSFDRYANESYPSEFRQAYDSAYNQAYIASYRDHYDRSYTPVFQQYYQSAFQVAFPKRKEEGYRNGYQDGYTRGKEAAYQFDFQKGFSDGDRDGYQNTYPIAYREFEAAGYSQAVKYYSENSVLSAVTSSILDGNQDQVFAPGEALNYQFIVKNYGKKASGTNLSLIAREWSSGVQVSQPSTTAPSIPGTSQATVLIPSPILIKESTPPGSQESVRFDLVSNGGGARGSQVIGSFTAQFGVSYPYSFSAEETPDFAIPGEEFPVRLSIQNISTRASEKEIRVNLNSRKPGIEVNPRFVSLGKLSPGSTGIAEFKVRLQEGAEFEKLEFDAFVVEGEKISGKRQIQFDSTRRWSFNPSARGLLIVNQSELAKSSLRSMKAAGLEVDFWDPRIEGVISAETLLQYSKNQILFLPELNRTLDPAIRSAVTAFLARGGTLFTTQGSDSSVLREIENEGQKFQFESFESLRIAFSNRFDRVQTQIFLADRKILQRPEELKSTFQLVELLAQDIRGQMNTLIRWSQNPQFSGSLDLARSAVIRTLIREMEDDKAVGGDHYKEDRENLALTAYVSTTLSLPVRSNERRELLLLFPQIDDGRKDIGWALSPRRLQIKRILKPLKKAYKSEIKD